MYILKYTNKYCRLFFSIPPQFDQIVLFTFIIYVRVNSLFLKDLLGLQVFCDSFVLCKNSNSTIFTLFIFKLLSSSLFLSQCFGHCSLWSFSGVYQSGYLQGIPNCSNGQNMIKTTKMRTVVRI